MYKIGDRVWVSKKDKRYKGTIEETSSYEDNWYLVKGNTRKAPTDPEWVSEDNLSLFKNKE